jgi:carbon monoxide dehydrogenase subunit G
VWRVGDGKKPGIEGKGRSMRIEGSYTVPVTAERVYAALMTPALLTRAIPGCERLIQLGPSDAEGDASFEARVRAEASVCVVSLHVRGGRQHNRVELSLRASGAEGAYTGHGSITLVRHVGQTLLSYSIFVDGRAGSVSLPEATLQEVARRCCDGLAEVLAEPAEPDGGAREVALAQVANAGRAGFGWIGQRAVWMTGGLLVGVAALGLLSGLARRLASRP